MKDSPSYLEIPAEPTSWIVYYEEEGLPDRSGFICFTSSKLHARNICSALQLVDHKSEREYKYNRVIE